MQPILALLPDKNTPDSIFAIRKNIITKKWGNEDTRKNTLPHISLVYTNSDLDRDNLEPLIQEIENSFNALIETTLPIVSFQTWDNKISAMFDPQKLSSLTQKASAIFAKLSTLDQTINPNEIADHMKIARNIKPEHLQQTQSYIKKTLPQQVTFDKLVLINYNCTEKDILWEKKS